MLVAPHDAFGLVGIDVGILEQAHLEFPIEHRRDQFVELLLFEHALADQFDQVLVAIRLGQFDVDAGFAPPGGRLPSCPGDGMAADIGAIVQLGDGVVVGDNEALESPLLAEDVAQQPFVGVRGNAIDFVVGGHDAEGAGLLDGLFEGNRKVSRNTRSEMFAGAQFVPDSGWPCAAKCFRVAMTRSLFGRWRRLGSRGRQPCPCAIPEKDLRRRSLRRGPSVARGRHRPRE